MRNDMKIAMITAFLMLSLATISSASAANTYNINQSSYSNYFNTSGYINNPNVHAGDVLDCSGTLTNKDMYINMPLNITSSSKTGTLINGTITILSSGSGTNITNLKIINSNQDGSGIFLSETENNTIKGNYIHCNGPDGFGIALVRSQHNIIYGNTVITTQRLDMARTHSTIVLGESDHNTIENNIVESDGACCIYLSPYSSGNFESNGPSYYNDIINNTCVGVDTSWSYGIKLVGSYNTAKNNKILSKTFTEKTSPYSIGTYIGISSELDSEGGNIIIGNSISATYCGIFASSKCIVSNNTITNYNTKYNNNNGISAGPNCKITENIIYMSKGYGIYLTGSNCTITRNKITTKGTQESIYLYGGITGNNITINTINSNSTGIMLKKQSTTTLPTKNTLNTNRITTTNTYAIDSSQGNKNTITNNYLISNNNTKQGNNAVHPGTGDTVTGNYGIPQITKIDPTKNSTTNNPRKIIKITYNETIKKSTGQIILKNTKGTKIPIKTTTNNNTLIITPTKALTNGTYYIILYYGCITDQTGNKATINTSKFTVDTIPPKITKINPAKYATINNKRKVIKITYNETIKKSTGQIILKNTKGTKIPIKTTTNNNTLIITPTKALTNGTYYIILYYGCITDQTSNKTTTYTSKFTVRS